MAAKRRKAKARSKVSVADLQKVLKSAKRRPTTIKYVMEDGPLEVGGRKYPGSGKTHGEA